VFERKIFFNLKIYGKLEGLSNKFEPSMYSTHPSSRDRGLTCIYVKC
jgi:hypothetical protein